MATTSSSSSATGEEGSGGAMEAVQRPDLLVTSISRATHTNAGRKDRDTAFIDVIHNTIRSGRSILMPVDASARLLELLVLLDQHWAYAYPTARFPLCLVSTTGREVIERARTLMEWMTKQWAAKGKEDGDANEDRSNKNRTGGGRGNQAVQQAPSSPLDFKYLRVFSSMKAMDDVLAQSDAKLVLAWPPSMAYGPSRKYFARMASNERDVVLLTSRGEPDTLTRWLWDRWEAGQNHSDRWGLGKVGHPIDVRDEVEVEIKSKVFLEGEELQAHNDAQRLAKEKAEQQRALLARSHRRLEADEEDVDSDDSDSEGESIDDGEGGGGDGQLGKVLGSSKMINGDGMGRGGDGDGGAAGGDELSFDIYLKGNAQRATSFFGSSGASGGLQRFRMFPMIEKRKRVDGYGETLDVGRWLSRRRELEAEAKVNGGENGNLNPEAAAAAAKRRKLQEEKEARERKEQEEKPSKFVSETRTLHVACKVSFVDMDGLANGRAFKELLPRLQPRRLVLVGGMEAERTEMTRAMKERTMKNIFAPVQGERVQIGEFTASFTVHLGEGLLAGLDLSSFDDYQIAKIRAKVRYGAESNVPTLELDSSMDAAELNSTTLVGRETAEGDGREEAGLDAGGPSTLAKEISASASKTLFIGDLRLSALKAALARAHRMPSEFAGEGTLVCGADAFASGGSAAGASNSKQSGAAEDGEGGAVRVQKSGEGQIIIEGNVGRGFYKVRNAVYDLHAKVDG